MQESLHFLRRAEDSTGPVYAFFPGDGHFFRIKPQKIKQNFVFLTESMIELDREKDSFRKEIYFPVGRINRNLSDNFGLFANYYQVLIPVDRISGAMIKCDCFIKKIN